MNHFDIIQFATLFKQLIEMAEQEDSNGKDFTIDCFEIQNDQLNVELGYQLPSGCSCCADDTEWITFSIPLTCFDTDHDWRIPYAKVAKERDIARQKAYNEKQRLKEITQLEAELKTTNETIRIEMQTLAHLDIRALIKQQKQLQTKIEDTKTQLAEKKQRLTTLKNQG